MPHVLLTFLGRVSKEAGTYRETRYDFRDGTQEEPAAFFGWPLQRRLQPDRLVILGTAGSMWDHLFEGDFDFYSESEDDRLVLQDAVVAQNVERAHLEPLAPLLSERLGCEVVLDLIPYCRDMAEQVKLLDIMASHVGQEDKVDLDVTHGFRHLPMVALLAALQLQTMRRAKVQGIWYGAFDPDTGDAPVYNLDGLLHIAEWLQALHTYDKDGDYGAFAHLLGPAGELLARAAFFERASNAVKAREALTAWVSREDQIPADDPAAALFGEELQRRVSWYRESNRSAREKALARLYLDRGDFVRAAIYGQEAVITADVEAARGDPGDFETRDEAREDRKNTERSKAQRRRAPGPFAALGHIRNALAHGVVKKENKQLRNAINDPANLRAELDKLFKELH